MAGALKLLLFLITSMVAAAMASTSFLPPLQAPSPDFMTDHHPPDDDDDYHTLFAPILSNLGFDELAAAAVVAGEESSPPISSLFSSSASAAINKWRGPITIFAPTDASIRTCTSCNVPILLREHTVPGLYSLHYLTTLAFGTKIETLATSRCLTVTSADNSSKIYINGAEITHPELHNDGVIVVHGIHGFIAQLSPLSCNIERMTSLSFPPPPPMAEFLMMHQMVKDAMVRLRISGYSVLALALRLKYGELMEYRNVTVFALDDAAIFSGGHEYISDLKFHIVPNRLLMNSDLEILPAGTKLPTMERGRNLVVTTAGGGGPLAPMRINYVTIKSADIVHNGNIVIHGLSMPFPHIHGGRLIRRPRCTQFEQESVRAPAAESRVEMYCNDRRHRDRDRDPTL